MGLLLGGIVLLVGIIVGQPGTLPKILTGCGAAVVAVSLLIPRVDFNVPTPGPAPGPGPNPIPTPGVVTPFGEEVAALFTSEGGTSDEAQELGALFTQWSREIAWDGSRAAPRVRSTRDMGERFAEVNRYRKLSESPWGDRFPVMKGRIAAELSTRQIVSTGAAQPLDPPKRSAAAQLFAEVGLSLEKL